VSARIRGVQRVLVISPVGQLGGAERALLDLIASARFFRSDLAFHVLLFADGPLRLELEQLGATVYVLALPASLNSIGDSGLRLNRSIRRAAAILVTLVWTLPLLGQFVFRLRRAMQRIQPDLVQTNGIKAHLITGLAIPARVPLIWHVQDFLSERLLARHLLSLAARRVSIAVAISNAVAADIRRLIPALRVATVLNAIDTVRFSPGDGDGPSLDRLANMAVAPSGTYRVGLIAAYARWKGQDVLLEAFSRLGRSLPALSLRLYIVGGPIYTTDASQFTADEMGGLISELGLTGLVGLIPFQRNVVPILRSLDIVVHASRKPEPFGLSIVEAMACGRPVVAAKGGGVDEIVENGVTGMLHLPGDGVALAELLRTLIDAPELRDRLATAGRRAAVARFSRPRLGPEVVALYDSVM
jgi:glycosyltransferase involved in cell wall biosynthesis